MFGGLRLVDAGAEIHMGWKSTPAPQSLGPAPCVPADLALTSVRPSLYPEEDSGSGLDQKLMPSWGHRTLPGCKPFLGSAPPTHTHTGAADSVWLQLSFPSEGHGNPLGPCRLSGASALRVQTGLRPQM